MPEPRIRFNWTVPVPVILAIAGQASAILFGLAVWKTTIEKTMEQDRLNAEAQFRLVDARVAVIERGMASNEKVVERVTRVEEQVGGLKEQGSRIEDKIDKLVERRR